MRICNLYLGYQEADYVHTKQSQVSKSPRQDTNTSFFDKLYNEKLGKVSEKVKNDNISQIIKQEKELTFHPKINNKFNQK